MDKGGQPTRAEIVGSQQQFLLQILEYRIQRQDHERQQQIHQTNDHGALGIEQLQGLIDQPDRHQGAVQQTVGGQNQLQGVGAHQGVGPERHDQQEDQYQLTLFANLGERPGKRIANQQAHQCGHGRHVQGVQENLQIQRVKQLAIGIQIQGQRQERDRVPGHDTGTDHQQVRCQYQEQEPAPDQNQNGSLERLLHNAMHRPTVPLRIPLRRLPRATTTPSRLPN